MSLSAASSPSKDTRSFDRIFFNPGELSIRKTRTSVALSAPSSVFPAPRLGSCANTPRRAQFIVSVVTEAHEARGPTSGAGGGSGLVAAAWVLVAMARPLTPVVKVWDSWREAGIHLLQRPLK